MPGGVMASEAPQEAGPSVSLMEPSRPQRRHAEGFSANSSAQN